MRRVGYCVSVCLVLTMLVALATSCGEESSEVMNERPAAGDAAAPEAPAPPQPAEDGGTQRTEAAEKSEGAEVVEQAQETTEAEDKEAAEQYAYEYQYGEQDAAQYGSSASEGSSSRQYAAAEAPEDPTMYLSIPKLGIVGAVVLDGEAGLEAGAMHLPGTGYPWLPNSNTYIAGHRVGFPGTGSDHIFYSLPAMAPGDEVVLEDSNGQVYAYSVSEVFAVTPSDTWVTAPTGSDTVTLQVCTETPDDWWTIGPRLMESGPDSGRLIVRANRVA